MAIVVHESERGGAINNYPGAPHVTCVSWSNQDDWPPHLELMSVEVEDGLARRSLLGKTDSRTFRIQKKSPKKGKDIEGGWQGM